MTSSPLGITGSQGLQRLAADLSREGQRGRRFKSRLRRAMTTSTAPITREAQQGWQGGYGGLGDALAGATRARVRLSNRAVVVAVMVDAKKLPPGKQGLAPLIEGFGRWRHPLFGDREHWYDQDPRPELGPAVQRHIPGVTAEIITAVDATAVALARG